MKQIGFKNFRKFENFPVMDLGDITILVGGNNAGKSTVVKALLLIFDNLRSMHLSFHDLLEDTVPFRFDANNIHDIHIDTFDRALYNKSKDRCIKFDLTIDKFSIELSVVDSKEYVYNHGPMVDNISVSDNSRNVKFIFDYGKSTMSVEIKSSDADENTELTRINEEIKELEERLTKEHNPFEAANLNTQLDKLKYMKKNMDEEPVENNDINVTTALSSFMDYANENELVNRIHTFAKYPNAPTSKPKVGGNQSQKEEARYQREIENKNILADKSSMFNQIATDLNTILTQKKVEYIYAHAASQKAVFSYEDKNDYLAWAIHDYLSERINEGDEEYLFILDWMKMDENRFEIGYKFEIESVLGVAYRVKIIHEKGGEGVELADMGMGSIQLMILLWKLATYIRRYKEKAIKPTIVIEEPEQNLHPKVQSKLANLLIYLNEKYKFKFIVETHSEYLVRNTQLIAADLLKKTMDNPFKTYYFTGEGPSPYKDMGYQESGMFKEKFGQGFFDEAGRLHMAILGNRERRRR